MPLAVHGRLALFDITARLHSAKGMQATLAEEINHAVFSMSLAVHRRLAALDT